MNYIIGLSYVHGPEFLERALASIRPHLDHVIVIDNSETLEESNDLIPVAERLGLPHLGVMRPAIPYTHTQTINLIYELARSRRCDVVFNMHTDAIAMPVEGAGTIDLLLARAAELFAAHRRWGILFTNYDCLACYNMAMVDDVGPWDSVLFPAYFSDNDFHHRVRMAGWEMIETGLPVQHTGSLVHKLDIRRRWLSHNVTFDHYHEMFRRKWNGYTHEQDKLWAKPYDGELDALIEDVEQRPKP